MEAPSFNTTSTIFPSGLLNATFGNSEETVLPKRTDPGDTNLDTCPMM